jgi:hypothetical protein
MNEQEIRKIIEGNNLSTVVFETELYTDMTDTYYHEFEKLPEFIQDGLGNGDIELEENWDQDYWGSDSVIQIQLHVRRNEQTVKDQLENWKDTHEKAYALFCNAVEASIWEHIQQQKNFETVNAIMRENRM